MKINTFTKSMSNALNASCASVICHAVDFFFSESDIIRFMGSYVMANKTLKAEWLYFLAEQSNPLDKVLFSVSRYKEAKYFRDKMAPKGSDESTPKAKSHAFSRSLFAGE